MGPFHIQQSFNTTYEQTKKNEYTCERFQKKENKTYKSNKKKFNRILHTHDLMNWFRESP